MNKKIVFLILLASIFFSISKVSALSVTAAPAGYGDGQDCMRKNKVCVGDGKKYSIVSTDTGHGIYGAYILSDENNNEVFCIENGEQITSNNSCSLNNNLLLPEQQKYIGYIISTSKTYAQKQYAIDKVMEKNYNRTKNVGIDLSNATGTYSVEAYYCGSNSQNVVKLVTSNDDDEEDEEDDDGASNLIVGCLTGSQTKNIGKCTYTYSLDKKLHINNNALSGRMIAWSSLGLSNNLFATLNVTGTCTSVGYKTYPSIKNYDMTLTRKTAINVLSTKTFDSGNNCYSVFDHYDYEYEWIDGKKEIKSQTPVYEYTCIRTAHVDYTFVNQYYAKNGNGVLSTSNTLYSKPLGYGIISDLDESVSNGKINFSISNTSLIGTCDYSVNKKVLDSKDNLNIEFRIIDVKKPFLDKDGNVRFTKSNWCDGLDCSSNNNKVKNEIINSNNSYNSTKEGYIYKIKLTPSDIKTIREYNKVNPYDDYNLTCDINGRNCTSNFLTDLKNGTLDSVYGMLQNRLIIS